MYGKSDKANAQGNQSEDFQAGFAAGKDRDRSTDNLDCIGVEYLRRKEPPIDTKDFAKFKEWKRGFWAGRMQEGVTKFYERNTP